jgi:ER degradation enhancer, mannosidase alpha-like 1
LQWKNSNSGIGAGIDSFYEYLLKSYVLFGNSKYLHMFNATYEAVNRHLKLGHWYVEGDMQSGRHTHIQFNSLQAFWPGLQVLAGDVDAAIPTQDAFYGLWQRYSGLPERFVLNANALHSTERYYPLRPEFVESAFHLYTATRHPYYLTMGKFVYESLMNVTRVAHGFASVQNVENGALEDRMNSFFLAETVKYLYLLFDEGGFVSASSSPARERWLFTTEGHLFPISHELHRKFGDGTVFAQFPTQSKSKSENRALIRSAARSVSCPP